MSRVVFGRHAGISSIVLFLVVSLGALEGAQRLPEPLPEAARHLPPVGRLPGGTRLNLAIGLPLRNAAALDDLLQQLYDPASTNFHRYLTPEQFAQRFGPAEQDYQAVMAFAQTNGFTVTATHPNRVLLDVSATAADIERALHVALRVYRHPKESRTFFAPDPEPSLDVSVPLLSISGLNNYALPRPVLSQIDWSGALSNSVYTNYGTGSGPGGSYLGTDFRAAYAPGVTLTGAGQTAGLVQFDGYYLSDIEAYESLEGLPGVPLENVLLDGFDGVPVLGSFNLEVSLDIEMVISMAPGLAKLLVYEAGPTGIPNDVLSRIATDNQAQVVSCSWYWGLGPDPTADQLFKQMAAQGQSFFCASGDYGAYAGSTSEYFPCDDANIITVGGTTLTTTGPGGARYYEIAWHWDWAGYASGGGISTSYPLPAWQLGLSNAANRASATMRNVPDVALPADRVYTIYANGLAALVAGTSCAAPLWAGFAALANQQAAATGAGPIGFVNPALYALGKATNYLSGFYDITVGNNTNANSADRFFAVAGYDLCTGWGTPKGRGLINALVPPPAPVIQSLVYTNGAMLLTWSSLQGQVYQAQFADSLDAPRWNNLGSPLPATGSFLSATDTSLGAAAAGFGAPAQRFYRVMRLP